MQQLNETDLAILKELSDGKRNIAVNIAEHIGKDKSYLNTRFRVLDDYGLVDRIGPSERSGLYEITAKGKFVAEHEAEFNDPDVEFGSFVEDEFQVE